MLNSFLPQYVRPAPIVSEQRLAELSGHGLSEDGAYALRCGFGAGSLGDLTRLVALAVQRGELLMAETLPFNDPGPMHANPYMGTPFGLNPAMADLSQVSGLNMNDEDLQAPHTQCFIDLINSRGTQMRESGDFEQGRFSHVQLRAFKLEALCIAFQHSEEQGGDEGFRQFVDAHLRDGDRTLDYAVFQALHDKHQRPWQEWDDRDKRRKPIEYFSEGDAHRGIQHEARFHFFVQSHLQKQVHRYANDVRAAGGRVIGDRAYGSDPDTPETLRSWREQHYEGKSGTFLLDEQGWPTHVNAIVEHVNGSQRIQRWGHPAINWPHAYEEAMTLVLDSLRPIAGYADGCRIDYALGFCNGTTYMDPRDDGTNYFQPGPKYEVFKRIAAEFPDFAVYCEAAGYADEDAHDVRRKAGLRNLYCLQWGGHPDEGDLGAIFCTDNQDTHTLPAITNADSHDWTLSPGHMRWMLQRTGAKDGVDVQTGVLRILEWIMQSKRQIVATTLASLSGELRCINEVGKQDPSYWQLLCPKTVEELEDVFRKIGVLARETRRSLGHVLSNPE